MKALFTWIALALAFLIFVYCLPAAIPKMTQAEELAMAKRLYQESHNRALAQIGGEFVGRLSCQACHK